MSLSLALSECGAPSDPTGLRPTELVLVLCESQCHREASAVVVGKTVSARKGTALLGTGAGATPKGDAGTWE